jgi:hypothetical protein
MRVSPLLILVIASATFVLCIAVAAEIGLSILLAIEEEFSLQKTIYSEPKAKTFCDTHRSGFGGNSHQRRLAHRQWERIHASNMAMAEKLGNA